MNTAALNADPGSNLNQRLGRIEQMLQRDPAVAEKLAADVLAEHPGQPMATLFQGIACRLQKNAQGAIKALTPLCERWPDAPLPHLQLGLALQEAGQHDRAERAMRVAVATKPDFSDAWLSLADLLRARGRATDADSAFVSYVQCSGNDPEIAAAATALKENRAGDAERILRARLERHPTDVAAMCLLADAFGTSGFPNEAEIMLRDCLALAPGYRAARQNYAVLLMWQNRPEEALQHCEMLLRDAPVDSAVLMVKANVLRRMGEYEQCSAIYHRVLDVDARQPEVWVSLGHTLRTLGQTPECIDAYRKAISDAPQTGQAWWSLANLKPSPLCDDDVQVMLQQLATPGLSLEDRIHFEFALGRALEIRKEHAESFRHYAEGNRLSHGKGAYDASELTDLVRRSSALFTTEFFAARKGTGANCADPIFIVGLPRSGSTLVEQILSSHSAVEGTTELPDIPALVKKLDERQSGSGRGKYPELLLGMDPERLRALGEEYLEHTRLQRKQAVPHFIDKMPNNFQHVGLIHLMLPNARIIDVRRHPLACGFSLFKLLFGHGQHFAYNFKDIACYYRDYVELMSHYDAVLPGRVYRVVYEALVEDTETEVRRLLEYCGLPFETGCLKFHETRRPVSTPSAEQVRSPIFREGIDQWRHYEPWLGPLKAALGELVDSYAQPKI